MSIQINKYIDKEIDIHINTQGIRMIGWLIHATNVLLLRDYTKLDLQINIMLKQVNSKF